MRDRWADAGFLAALATLPWVGVGVVHLLTGRDPGGGLQPSWLFLALATVAVLGRRPRVPGRPSRTTLLLLLAATLVTGWAARGRWWALPWWWPASYLSVVLIELTPSLSTHMIYQANGRIMLLAALPGLCLLAVAGAHNARVVRPPRLAIAQLAVPLAIAVAGLVITGGASHLWASPGSPPLIPRWTGHTSLFLALLFAGAAVTALVALTTTVRSGFRTV